MNYLAHIFLSNKNPEIMMGNFLGDLIKNKEYRALPLSLGRGVALHREIDHFTDTHPVVLSTINKLEPYHQKYSPVVSDIFYDYLLFKNWSKYSNETVQELANWCYDVINSYQEYIPDRHQAKVKMMVKHNWLLGYGNLETLHQTFLRVKKRARFESHFEFATQHLKDGLEDFNQDFNLFFPDLIKMSTDYIEKLDK